MSPLKREGDGGTGSVDEKVRARDLRDQEAQIIVREVESSQEVCRSGAEHPGGARTFLHDGEVEVQPQKRGGRRTWGQIQKIYF